MMIHIPVLLCETIQHLALESDHIVLDGTIGFGGHSRAILDHLKNGTLIGLDQDPEAVSHCKKKFKADSNAKIFHSRFDEFPIIFKKLKIKTIDRVLLDLGMSSFQLNHAGRGFSFQVDEPLDLRMNPSEEIPTAAELLTRSWEKDLTKIFKDYGELYRTEKFVGLLIKAKKTKPIQTTFELVDIIKKGFFFRDQRSLFIKTCAQVFQALRIAVNHELDVLPKFLDLIGPYLSQNGRIGIITFHSLEDRIVKHFFRSRTDEWKRIVKSLKPSQDEIRSNPRSRSAKLRVYEKK